jgi:threonine dehydrogenase-like Zn-dependent dehydrogenase
VLPTAWQAVEYAAIPKGGSVAVFGLGPIGQMSARIALHQGAEQVFGIDRVPERLEMAGRHGVEAIDFEQHDDISATLRELTGGRGPDNVIEAVGMEAHGAPAGKVAQAMAGLPPDDLSAKLIEKAGTDRMAALIGVYGGMVDPMPMMQLFDKGVQIRMGQAHVRRWTDEILPLLEGDEDPLGVDDLTTHELPLAEAPNAYEMFQKKEDGAIKVVLKP